MARRAETDPSITRFAGSFFTTALHSLPPLRGAERFLRQAEGRRSKQIGASIDVHYSSRRDIPRDHKRFHVMYAPSEHGGGLYEAAEALRQRLFGRGYRKIDLLRGSIEPHMEEQGTTVIFAPEVSHIRNGMHHIYYFLPTREAALLMHQKLRSGEDFTRVILHNQGGVVRIAA